MSSALLTEYDDTWLEINSEYNKEFITALKETLPCNSRYWNPDEKVWRVKRTFKSIVILLLEEYYNYVDIQISDEQRIKELEAEIRKLQKISKKASVL